MSYKYIISTLLVLFQFSIFAESIRFENENINSVSRYVTLEPTATNAQRHPIQAVIPVISFGNNIKTVGQAMRYVLNNSGYRLTRFHKDKRVLNTLSLPLPQIHRKMGPLTLEETLETLAGYPWILMIDPINRLVSFVTPLSYKSKSSAKVYKKPTYHKKPHKRVIKKARIKRYTKSKVRRVVKKRHSKRVVRGSARKHYRKRAVRRAPVKRYVKRTVPAKRYSKRVIRHNPKVRYKKHTVRKYAKRRVPKNKVTRRYKPSINSLLRQADQKMSRINKRA